MAELENAIKYLPNRKAVGPDEISNKQLTNLTMTIKLEVLKLANLIWETGELPQSFRKSNVVPVFKGGTKSSKQLSSYRPVALTSCLCKLVERLVLNRLTHHLETNQKLHFVQSAFRSGRSTLDPLMRMVSDINEGFEKNPFLRTLAVKLELKSAYNSVDHLHLLIF